MNARPIGPALKTQRLGVSLTAGSPPRTSDGPGLLQILFFRSFNSQFPFEQLLGVSDMIHFDGTSRECVGCLSWKVDDSKSLFLTPNSETV